MNHHQPVTEVLEPFAWADLREAPGEFGGIKAACILRTPDGPVPSSETDARRALFDQAEQAIAAVEAAGWSHLRGPDIEITGARSDRGGMRCELWLTLTEPS